MATFNDGSCSSKESDLAEQELEYRKESDCIYECSWNLRSEMDEFVSNERKIITAARNSVKEDFNLSAAVVPEQNMSLSRGHQLPESSACIYHDPWDLEFTQQRLEKRYEDKNRPRLPLPQQRPKPMSPWKKVKEKAKSQFPIFSRSAHQQEKRQGSSSPPVVVAPTSSSNNHSRSSQRYSLDGESADSRPATEISLPLRTSSLINSSSNSSSSSPASRSPSCPPHLQHHHSSLSSSSPRPTSSLVARSLSQRPSQLQPRSSANNDQIEQRARPGHLAFIPPAPPLPSGTSGASKARDTMLTPTHAHATLISEAEFNRPNHVPMDSGIEEMEELQQPDTERPDYDEEMVLTTGVSSVGVTPLADFPPRLYEEADNPAYNGVLAPTALAEESGSDSSSAQVTVPSQSPLDFSDNFVCKPDERETRRRQHHHERDQPQFSSPQRSMTLPISSLHNSKFGPSRYLIDAGAGAAISSHRIEKDEESLHQPPTSAAALRSPSMTRTGNGVIGAGRSAPPPTLPTKMNDTTSHASPSTSISSSSREVRPHQPLPQQVHKTRSLNRDSPPVLSSKSASLTLPLDQQSWYHDTVSRERAEALLSDCSEGTFLVRKSESSRKSYSLSVVCNTQVLHLKIEREGSYREDSGSSHERRYILGQFGLPFTSLPNLINHYKRHVMPIYLAKHIYLHRPLPRQNYYHAIEYEGATGKTPTSSSPPPPNFPLSVPFGGSSSRRSDTRPHHRS